MVKEQGVECLNERLATIEAMLLIQKGQIEILLGLVFSKFGKDQMLTYLESVCNSSDFGDSAKLSAKEMILHQEKLWGSTPHSMKQQ